MRLGYFTMPVHPASRNPTETLREDREIIILAVVGLLVFGPERLPRAAADAAYATCARIGCASKYYRRDIGARQLQRG